MNHALWKKRIGILGRCLGMLYKPLPAVLAAILIWYFGFYRNGIILGDNEEVLLAWISIFGVLYGLLEAVVLSTVWSEYKTMRTAVKRYDFETFADLRDEEISPLVHTLSFVLSCIILAGFMSLRYENFYHGAVFVGSTAYLFMLIFLVIYEIDDPCEGTWVIRNIPKEWLEVDVKRFREGERYRKGRELFEPHRTRYGRHVNERPL